MQPGLQGTGLPKGEQSNESQGMAAQFSQTVIPGGILITAAHSAWFERLFRVYILRLLRKSFAGIHVYGIIPAPASRLPVVLVPNHSTWWDGFLIYLLNLKIFDRPLYLMMTEEQLRTYRFFSRVGAYSIPLGSPRGILESLRYSITLLEQPQDPAPLVCLFPQGELTSWFRRPLVFHRGLEWILTRYPGELTVIPLAIRAEFREEQRPEVFCLFDEKREMAGTDFPGMRWLEQAETQLLDRLVVSMRSEQPTTTLLRGTPSVDTWYRRFTRKVE